jgi:hypothetical protein
MAKYLARVGVPVTEETRAIYEAAAEAVGMELTAWVRLWLEEGIPTMQAVVEAHKQGGVGPIHAFIQQKLAEAVKLQQGFVEEGTPATESA